MKKFVFILPALSLAFPLSAFAGNYGMSGCGLGAVIVGRDGSQLIGATTNQSSPTSQTLGITSGTSECHDADELARAQQRDFVRYNYAQISRDAAIGEGEFLTALADVLGCSEEVHSAFFEMTKKRHEQFFGEYGKPSKTLESIKNASRENETLKNTCSRLI